MARFEPADEAVLRYSDRFGPGTLCNFLTLLAGIFFGTLALIFRQDAPFLYGFAAVGGYWLLRGLNGLLFTRGLTIDRARGRFRVWRGWLVPLWGKSRKLESYRTVRISKKLVREGRTHVPRFVLELVGKDGRVATLTAKRDYLAARQMAERIAGYLWFDLLDAATSGDPVLIAAPDVGKSLRERTRTGSAHSPPGELVLPAPPKTARCRCFVDGSWLFIEIPPPHFRKLVRYPIFLTLFTTILGSLLGVGIVYLGGDWQTNLIPGLGIGLGVIALGFCYSLFILVLPNAFVRYHIEAHPGGLNVRRRGLIFRRAWEMSSAELRELRVHRWGLEAIGAEQILRFADNRVSAAELRWLREAIEKAVTA